MNIGEKVKNLRKEKKITIQKMSELIGLSTGFISQFERGITTIDVDHLNDIATVLDINISYFFQTESASANESEIIVRRYERPIIRTLNKAIYFNLSGDSKGKNISPKYVELLPSETKKPPASYGHIGEEFVYVLEGTLIVCLEDHIYKLYPGDSAHFLSTRAHNWANNSDSIVKFIAIHYPNTEDTIESSELKKK